MFYIRLWEWKIPFSFVGLRYKISVQRETGMLCLLFLFSLYPFLLLLLADPIP